MPLAIDPNATVEFSLTVDRQKPDDTRPVFLCRHLSCRQVREVRQLLGNAAEEKDADKVNTVLNDVLAVCLAGWKNIPATFGPEAFDDVLTPSEKGELSFACVTEPRLKENDLKNSAPVQP